MKAVDYFQENIDRVFEGYLTPVVEAYRVQAGKQEIVDPSLGVPNLVTIEKDGWMVKWPKFLEREPEFFDNEQFQEAFSAYDGEGTLSLRGDFLMPVKKGEVISVANSGYWNDIRLPCDGYILTTAHESGIFISEAKVLNTYMMTDDLRESLDKKRDDQNQGVFQQKSPEAVRFMEMTDDDYVDYEGQGFSTSFMNGDVLIEVSGKYIQEERGEVKRHIFTKPDETDAVSLRRSSFRRYAPKF